MGHRLILKPESRLRKITTSIVLDEIVSEIAVPSVGAVGEDAMAPNAGYPAQSTNRR